MAQTGARAESAHNPLSLSDLDTSDTEPRILDLRIAERLGFERPRAIRQIIERNRAELEGFGSLATRCGKSRGQDFTEYHLTEGQTLLVCMLSRTERAAAIRKEVISVFMAWRWGQLPTAKPARLSLRDMDRARLLVAECRHLHGPAAARALWCDLGLPGPAPDQAPPIQTPKQPPDLAQLAGLHSRIAQLEHRDRQLLSIIDRLSRRATA